MRRCYYVIVGFFLSVIFSNVIAADTNSSPRLTIELRDGSRVIGTSVEENFKFHSALLGDLKLGVKDIRSIDCIFTNLAKLTADNGDVLTVWFTSSEVRVNAGFGKVGLSVNSIRRVSVSSVRHRGRTREGLVALWSGEGNANDSAGTNNGVTSDGVSYAPGEVGNAFVLDGISSSITAPASPSLAVSSFTIEGWINPVGDTNRPYPIAEYGMSGAHAGVHFWINQGIGPTPGAGNLFANLQTAPPAGAHYFATPAGVVPANKWTHVALTFDQVSGDAQIYVNGTVVASANLGIFTPGTSMPFNIGYRPIGSLDIFGGSRFLGKIDEISIYNRALSSSEIQDDYAAGDINN